MKNTVTSYTPQPHTSLKSYRKERNGFYKEYKVINLDSDAHKCPYTGMIQHSTAFIVRVYWPRDVAYACVWLSFATSYSLGRGKAGGYGYCKESAAISEALESAGVKLAHSIHGVGEQAVKGALVALVEFAGLTNYTLTVAHA